MSGGRHHRQAGDVHQAAGDHEARVAWLQAGAILSDLDHPDAAALGAELSAPASPRVSERREKGSECRRTGSSGPMRILTLAAGVAAGYVLGSKAGREKYEQIAATARKVNSHPTVVQAQEKAKGYLQSGADAVTAKLKPTDDTTTPYTPAVTAPPAVPVAPRAASDPLA